jgi:iron complex outermembrane receptor protein
MKKFRVTVLAVVALFVAGAAAFAQGVSVTGRVVDPQGAVVANADVSLAPMGAARGRVARTTADGTFMFDGIAPGDYVVVVQAPGFAVWSQTVSVTGQPASVDVMLAIAGLVEDVTIEGALTGTTATGKTNLPLRELPMTVHAVGPQVLREQAANDLVTALQNVPAVNAFTNYGVYQYYAFRGFVDQDVQLVDGVRNEGNRINTQLAHIDRVEVLKGPSSALYGGGALGATVNLIRKKPSPQPAFDFSATAGSWSTARGTFGATGRLRGESLLYRLDVGADARDGYRHNDTRRVNVTPTIAWRLTDNDQVNIYYTFTRDRFLGDGGIPLLNTNNGTPTAASVVPNVPRDTRLNTPFDEAASVDNNIQFAYARQLHDNFGFRNTLSYRHFNDEYFVTELQYVLPASSRVYREFLYFKHHRRPLTNVAELTGLLMTGTLAHNLVIGWDVQQYGNNTYRTPGGGVAVATEIDLLNPVETQTQPNLRLARDDYFSHTTNAFYLQDHVTLSSQLKLLAGLRYDIFRRSSHNDPVANGEFLVGSGSTTGSAVVTNGPLLKRDAEALTGRIGLVYQPRANVDLYGSFANSFKPLTQANADGRTLEPERGRQFEFGNRLHLMNERVQVNTTVFHILRENVAFSRPGGNFDQAAQVRSRGFEAEVQTTPVSHWRVNGGYSFTDAEFLDYRTSLTVDLSGNRPRSAPRHTFSLWTGYDWANGFGVNLGVRALGGWYGDDTNMFKVDGYGLANVGVRYLRGNIEYALNVNNITDTDYISSVLYNSQVYPGDPINVLGTIRVRLR